MRICEIVNYDAEKMAADNLAKNAKQMKQHANAAKARVKLKTAQQQLVKAVQPIAPKL